MLTAIITAGEGDGERLARTLQSLMPGVLEGLLREAVVVDPSDAPEIASVADHAGCGLRPDIQAAIADAKGTWLLFLEAGARLDEGWSEAVRAHAEGSTRAARFRAAGGWLKAIQDGRRPFGLGLAIRRDQALESAVGARLGVRPARLNAAIRTAR